MKFMLSQSLAQVHVPIKYVLVDYPIYYFHSNCYSSHPQIIAVAIEKDLGFKRDSSLGFTVRIKLASSKACQLGCPIIYNGTCL